MDRFTGGCLCNSVRLLATGRPYRVGLCHCLYCRKHHGALFHASAVFPRAAVTIDGETSDYERRFFCPRCCRRSRLSGTTSGIATPRVAAYGSLVYARLSRGSTAISKCKTSSRFPSLEYNAIAGSPSMPVSACTKIT